MSDRSEYRTFSTNDRDVHETHVLCSAGCVLVTIARQPDGRYRYEVHLCSFRGKRIRSHDHDELIGSGFMS